MSKRSNGASSDESSRNIPAIKDTHFYETAITYRSYTLPIRVPLYTFEEEVGEVSIRRYTRNRADRNVAVFYYPTYSELLQWCTCSRPSTSASTHKWCTDTSNHITIQCNSNGEASAFPKSWEAGGRGLQLRPRCMCLGFWMRINTPRFDLADVSLCQLV